MKFVFRFQICDGHASPLPEQPFCCTEPTTKEAKSHYGHTEVVPIFNH